MNERTVQDILTGKIPAEHLPIWTPERVAKTVCAFANDYENKGAGYLLLDLKTTANIEQEINAIHKCCKTITPKYDPFLKVIHTAERPLLLLWLPRGMERPYLYAGLPFLLSQGLTLPASPEELNAFLELVTRPSFDELVHPEGKLEDICLPMLCNFLEKTKHPLGERARNMDSLRLYNTLGLISYTKNQARPNNAALLLFSLTPTQFFPQSTIRVMRYYDGKNTCFSRKTFAGSLFLQRMAVMEYFQNAVLEYFNDTEECSNYPLLALWEAVNNAILHKDYNSPSPIDIRITPEHISIMNPVSKEAGLSAQECSQGIFALRPSSIPHVAALLQEKRAGAGLLHLTQALEENASPRPLFSLSPQGDAFTIKILSHPTFCTAEQRERFSRGIASPQRNAHTKMKEAIRKAIITAIQDNPCVPINALAQSLRLSKSRLYHHLAELKQEGILLKQGRGMTQHWELIKSYD